jgi:hypothetical protein
MEALRFLTALLVKCQQSLNQEDLLVVGPMISNFGEILSDGSEHCVSVEVCPRSEFDVAGKDGQGCNSVVFFS